MDKSKVGAFFLGFLVLMLVLSFSRKGVYSQDLGINLVVVGELKVSLLSIRPKEEVVNWADLPNNLMVKVYTSGVSYPVVSLWKLGVMERDKYNHVGKSLAHAMGISLPRVIWVGKETTPESLLRALSGFLTETNLSWRDRMLLKKDLTSFLAAKKIIEVSIPETALDKSTEPDGKVVVGFNSILSLWNKNKFLVESILGEEMNARVYNMSEQKGQGLLYSRMLEAVGMRVTEVATGTEKNMDMATRSSGCYYGSGTGVQHVQSELFLTTQMDCKKINLEEGMGIEKNEIVVLVY